MSATPLTRPSATLSPLRGARAIDVQLPIEFPSPRLRGEGARRADEGSRPVLISFLLFLLALPLAARADDVISADRPGIADGSTTVGRGVFQAEVGAERDDDGVHVLITPLLLRYGVTKDVELRFETAGYGRILGGGGDGWSPVSAGVKWHFAEEDTKTHRPSLGIIARLFPKSGSGAFKSDETAGDLRLSANMTLNDHWSLNPNIGAAFGNGTHALAALTAQYSFNDHVGVFVDGGYADESILLDTGGAWVIGNDLQLDLSAGWRVHGRNAPNLFVGAGISKRF
jgi:hypothetical protein